MGAKALARRPAASEARQTGYPGPGPPDAGLVRLVHQSCRPHEEPPLSGGSIRGAHVVTSDLGVQEVVAFATESLPAMRPPRVGEST